MARGRMLSQTVATDRKLNELSVEAELLYLKAIPHLDRDGLIFGEAMLLWAQVCPRRPDLMAKMEGIINEWLSSGLVIAYQDNGDTILFFPGFTKNQTGMRYDREAASPFGVPPGYVRTACGLTPAQPETTAHPANDDSADQLRMNSGPTPDELRTNSPPSISISISKSTSTTSGDAVVSGGFSLPKITTADVHALWQNNMPGTMTQIIADELDDLIATYTAPEVDAAIRLAVKANKRSMSYVAGILRKRASGDDKPPPKAKAVSGKMNINMASV